MANQARRGKPDPCPKQPQVGCMCTLALMLLEPLMRIAAANRMSEKLATLRERRKRNLVR